MQTVSRGLCHKHVLLLSTNVRGGIPYQLFLFAFYLHSLLCNHLGFGIISNLLTFIGCPATEGQK